MIAMEPVPAWCLVNGEWIECEDPVMAACDPQGGDVYAAMAGLGFEAWCRIGDEGFAATPLTLTVYSREKPPLQFLLQLEGNAGNVVEHVFAETLPDAMNLLAAWAPVAQAGALVELARRSGDGEPSPVLGPRLAPSRPFAPGAAHATAVEP
ncbi:hypothetical protein [Actinoallomurus rhizosphaericola]|uniref:hypothetical protein n=1 Tax=Actinoallomurus rhizosphaericola TaxID=2952536 RepID=UPI0020908554|nr:hypothetical protein [Actinoallomurus rhizosphaericola]MCO5993431.1 hypothetical protein [Actinoallomurus rhizosphaericola]